jgi:fucose permease
MTRTLRSTQYLAFVGLGFAQGIVGPLLPQIQAEVPMSDWQAGLVGSGQFVGVLLVGLAGGQLADRFGKKAFVVAASVLMIVGLLGYVVAGAFSTLFLASMLAGLGSGGYEVGVNALQADHTEGDSGHSMNFLHFFYGLGAVGGPVAGTLAIEAGKGWRPAMVIAAILPALVAALLLSQRVSGGRATEMLRATPIYLRPALWVCGLVFAVYVGIEMGVGVWISTYWARRAAGSSLPAPLLGAIYWAMLTGGRLVCGRIADRIGHHRFLFAVSAAVVLVGTLWAAWPGPRMTVVVTVLFGALFAGIYPTAMALATDAFPGESGRVVGFLAVFVALGGFLLPSGVGRLSDAHGIGVLPVVIVAMSVVMLASVRALRLPAARASAVERTASTST